MRQIPGYLRSRINGPRQLSLSPIHKGTLENSTWHEDSTVLLNNLQFDPIVPQWGRQARAHSRVIDWINSLIPNRWIEYWCLVRPDHKRKTQSASMAQRFNPQRTFKLQSPCYVFQNLFKTICLQILSAVVFYHHSPAIFSFREIFFRTFTNKGRCLIFTVPTSLV